LRQSVFVGAVGWYWPRRLKAWPFGLDFGAIAGAAVAQSFGEILEGITSTVLFIPLLLVDSFLDRFAEVLHLDNQQRAKIKAHHGELLKDLTSFAAEIANKPESERAALMLDEYKRLAPKYRRHVVAVLHPDQRHRLDQIERQLQGVHAMLTDEGRKQLGLTDEQHTRLAEVAKQLGERVEQLRSGHEQFSALALGKLFLMRKVADVEAQQILNAEQRTKWHEYVGEPIRLNHFIPWDKIILELEAPRAEKPATK
jgi:hypothetical protein